MSDPRTRLEDERRRTTRRLAQLRGDFDEVVEASRDTNADDEHDPEGATIAFERSQIDTLVRLASKTLVDVDAALARLDDGTYGRCEVCGRDIDPERLEVRPTARTCVGCAGDYRPSGTATPTSSPRAAPARSSRSSPDQNLPGS